jgi:hypothetical protein
MHLICCLLPKPNRDTMEALFVFLKWVASFSHVDEETGSKMDLHNLATVICPNILYAKGKDPYKDESFSAVRAVHELLEYQDEFWVVSPPRPLLPFRRILTTFSPPPGARGVCDHPLRSRPLRQPVPNHVQGDSRPCCLLPRLDQDSQELGSHLRHDDTRGGASSAPRPAASMERARRRPTWERQSSRIHRRRRGATRLVLHLRSHSRPAGRIVR